MELEVTHFNSQNKYWEDFIHIFEHFANCGDIRVVFPLTIDALAGNSGTLVPKFLQIAFKKQHFNESLAVVPSVFLSRSIIMHRASRKLAQSRLRSDWLIIQSFQTFVENASIEKKEIWAQNHVVW